MIKALKKTAFELSPHILIRVYKYFKKNIYSKNRESIIEKSQVEEKISEDISTLIEDRKLNLTNESLIIGNGPSFNYFMDNHSYLLDNKTVFCLNSFADSEYFTKIKPLFSVFADPFYWNQNPSQEIMNRVNNTYEHLKKKVTWQIILLLPTAAREWNCFINLPNDNKHISLAYYSTDKVDENDEIKYLKYQTNKAMPHAQTVLVSAIFLSLNLGFKTQYVVGADMSFHEMLVVDKDNTVCIKESHFYAQKIKPVPYWKNPEHTEIWKMHEIFYAISLMFKGFTELEEYSKFLGAKIYNISNKSYIDAFERLDLDKIEAKSINDN